MFFPIQKANRGRGGGQKMGKWRTYFLNLNCNKLDRHQNLLRAHCTIFFYEKPDERKLDPTKRTKSQKTRLVKLDNRINMDENFSHRNQEPVPFLYVQKLIKESQIRKNY